VTSDSPHGRSALPSDPETRASARLLLAFLWIQLAGFGVYLVSAVLADPSTLGRVLSQVGFAVVVIFVLRAIVLRGWVGAAAVGYLSTAWFLLAASAWTGGGIRSSAALGFLVVVFAAGLLRGRRGAVLMGVGVVITGLLLALAEDHGLLPASQVQNTPLQRWDDLAVYCLMIVAFQALAIRVRKTTEARYRQVVERAGDAILTLSPEGVLAAVNPAFERMTGWPPEECLGKPFTELIASADGQGRWRTFLDHRGLRQSLELPLRQRNGQAVVVELNLAPVAGRDGDTLAVGRDVTERREQDQRRARLEAQLRQSQKLEAVGTLAGGIAHDFNNVLTAIMGHAHLLQEDVPKKGRSAERVAEILKAGARARDVVRQLLTFARSQGQPRALTRFQDVVLEAVQLLRASVPSSVQMEANIDPDTPGVLADATQLHQVVVNLVTNAADAMRDHGGRLTLALGRLQLDSHAAARLPPLEPGPHVRLRVSDTGHGMDPGVLGRVFEPFFTTKPLGHGTGLGLAVVHTIVSDHQGRIALRSKPGEGTTVEVILPQATQPIVVSEEATPEAPVRGNGERLLVVDDETAVLRVLAEQLQRLGYRVRTSTDPEEALETFSDDPDEFDLAITDLQMPGMSGVELAARFMSVRADLPVLLITGNRLAVEPHVLRAAGVRELVDKPFRLQDLSRAIRTALETSSS
jgi:PAS domain S-box-containing protein